MRNYQIVFVAAGVCGFLITGCHDDRGGSPNPPPTPSATDFETYAVELVQTSTCDSLTPAETNSIEFSFAADQDTAEPRDVSLDTTGCKASS